LYYVRNGELIQVEASKCPIGGDVLKYKDKKKFENTTIDYQKGDIFYLFSDGYQDQFGGPDNLKYYKKNFRNFLLNISHLPLKQQREELLNEFNRWKGNYAQTDDILVIGIKV
jgi:serine phosphatase RsbU (regulator of sigma subunit)